MSESLRPRSSLLQQTLSREVAPSLSWKNASDFLGAIPRTTVFVGYARRANIFDNLHELLLRRRQFAASLQCLLRQGGRAYRRQLSDTAMLTEPEI